MNPEPPAEYNPAKWTEAERAQYLAYRSRQWRGSGRRWVRLPDAGQEPWDSQDFPDGMGKRERMLLWLKTEFGRE